MRKKIWLILSILVIFSCSKNDNKQTVINFWAMGAEGEYIQKLIPEFEKRNPGIKVKVQMVPWTAAQEKLITAYASDNSPDAFQLGNTWIPQFAALNALEDLTPYINKSQNIKKENYYKGIWDTNILEDKIYGVPWYIDTRILFYRSDVLEEAGYKNPPKSWDELLDCARKVKTVLNDNNKYPIYIPTNEWVPFIVFGKQAGSNILKNNDSYGNFSGKEFKIGFTYLMQFFKEGLSPIGISQVTNVYQAFADKYINMYISGPWNIIEFNKIFVGKLKGKYKTAPMPGYKGEYPGLSLAGGASIVMYKKSTHKKEVWKFIEYLSEPKIQLEFYKYLFDLPAVKSAWQDTLIQNDLNMQAFSKQFENVVPTPKIPEWEQIAFSKVQQYAEFASRGTLTIDQALKKLDKDVNNILEKRRYILSKRK
ncbi:MAG: sugar ABC transporter substrate-binding protein [bacterium]